MGNDGWDEYVGISKCVVFKILVVNRVDGSENLLFKSFFDVGVGFEFIKSLIVRTISSCDLCCSCSCGMYWLDAWMVRCIECSTCTNERSSGGHDNAEMAVDAASAIRMKGSCIGVDFFL